jgi:hypothetical protein
LQNQQADLKQTIADRDRQIQTLQQFDDKRMELLFRVERIELGRYTGGYDSDGQPGHEGIRVYLQPIDQQGSVIKSAGDVDIKVFDLAEPEANNLILQYRYGVDTIAEHWASGFLTYHYSFDCPWPAGQPPRHQELVLRVEFTDYLTGKTFVTEKPVTVDLPTQQAKTE